MAESVWCGSWHSILPGKAHRKGTEALPARSGHNGVHPGENHGNSKLCTYLDWCSFSDRAAVGTRGHPDVRLCPTLTPGWDGSRGRTGGRCAQVEQLLLLVTEVQEEMSRLREGVQERD